ANGVSHACAIWRKLEGAEQWTFFCKNSIPFCFCCSWSSGRWLDLRAAAPFSSKSLAKVKDCRLQVELLTEIRNPNLLQKVASEDDDLLFRGALLTLFCHTFSPYYLGGERFSPFPAEAGYLF